MLPGSKSSKAGAESVRLPGRCRLAGAVRQARPCRGNCCFRKRCGSSRVKCRSASKGPIAFSNRNKSGSSQPRPGAAVPHNACESADRRPERTRRFRVPVTDLLMPGRKQRSVGNFDPAGRFDRALAGQSPAVLKLLRGEKACSSAGVGGLPPEITRTRHLPQVPSPPQGESTIKPADTAASITRVPGKTNTVRPAGWNVTGSSASRITLPPRFDPAIAAAFR